MLKVLRQHKHKSQNNTHKHTIKTTTQQTHDKSVGNVVLRLFQLLIY